MGTRLLDLRRAAKEGISNLSRLLFSLLPTRRSGFAITVNAGWRYG